MPASDAYREPAEASGDAEAGALADLSKRVGRYGVEEDRIEDLARLFIT